MKLFSSDQRLVQQDEICCVVCGKYGEYINKDTKQPICSVECLKFNTNVNQHRIKAPSRPKLPNFLFAYTADTLHAKLTHYQEPASIAIVGKRQLSLMLQAHRLTVSGSSVPKPMHRFDELSLDPTLLHNIEGLGWASATSIQRQTVPVVLAGRDTIVLGPPKSGKTASMLIPCLVHCRSLSMADGDRRRRGPYFLLITPRHQQAAEIEAVCQRLAVGLKNIRTGLLVGKEPLPNQIHRLKKGAQILIGTPGRLVELAKEHPKLLRLWNLQMIVLDEADTLWASHGVQLKQILGKIKQDRNRQLMCVSDQVENELFKKWIKKLKRPVEIKCEE
ncbi:unnamed protein product [Rhizopus stolonifer]